MRRAMVLTHVGIIAARGLSTASSTCWQGQALLRLLAVRGFPTGLHICNGEVNKTLADLRAGMVPSPTAVVFGRWAANS